MKADRFEHRHSASASVTAARLETKYVIANPLLSFHASFC